MKIFKKVVFFLLIPLLLVVLIISLFKVVEWIKNSIDTHNEMNRIENHTHIQEISGDESESTIAQNVNLPNSYPKYTSTSVINVDFDELKKINSDTVGWLQINGTNVNYPFVKTTDNSFYLTHSFSKSYNKAGWIFLDYRNSLKFSRERNTILYAHNRRDKTMFGSLIDILQSDWLSNETNYVIKLSTENENTLWKIFSVYRIPTTNDYLKINFKNDKEYSVFISTLINRSQHDFNTSVTTSDKILTLSTCYNNQEKFVVHSKLIKISEHQN